MHQRRKMKRLKSHRERNQIRGYGTKTSKCNAQHHHCRHLSRKDTAQFSSCCHSGCQCSSRRDVSSSSVISVPQEPNIITESRLIGHQGLFNHEVKSIDIERLLGEQRKMEKSKAQEKKKATFHPCSASQVPFPFSVDVCKAADTDKLMLFEDQRQEASNVHNKVGVNEKDCIQKLAHTLEQRPQRVLPELSPETCKSTNLTERSTRISDDVVESRKTKNVTSSKDRETQQVRNVNNNTPDKNTKEIISSLEQTPNEQGCSGLHTQTSSSNSPRRRDLHCGLSHSVWALAASLSSSLRFPFLRKRSLVEESRRVLLNALQEAHGPLLQENILRTCSRLSFNSSVKKGSLDQEETTVDHDEALFNAFIPQSPPCFENQEDTPQKMRRSRHFSWKSSPQLPHSIKQVKPVETFGVSFLDNIFRPSHSPKLCMNFEPTGSMASEHLFSPSPASSWEEKQSASPLWGDGCDWPRCKESVRFDSFNQTRAARDSRSSRSHRSELPSFVHQPQSQFQRAARPVGCLQDQVPFETESGFFGPFSVQLQQHQQQQRHLQSFHQIAPPLRCLPRLSHLSDMDTYPPSYVLDKETPPYFPSLEPWSFPPMRLY